MFSYGFRPFFFGGAAWALLAVLLWLPQLYGELTLPTALAPVDWHIHEMLYGYIGAVIAGFLLTAIPNWTGRLPVAGWPLAALFGLWLAGRLAIAASALVGAALAGVVDVAFLGALAAIALREIVAGRNWRNLRVLSVLALLIAGNVAFHAEAAWYGTASYGSRIAVAGVIVLITLIGGRIIPSFTHNWLARQSPGSLPQPFSHFDALAIAIGAAALAMWAFWPTLTAIGILLLVASVVHAARLGRWAGHRALAEPLILILHVGYGFVALGFCMLGLAVLEPQMVPTNAAIHAWTAGAMAIMTLAVMTRATLGHTGRPLVASPGTQVIYVLAIVAAVGRIAASFGNTEFLLALSALAWVGAFGAFLLIYGSMLMKPRL